MNRHKFPNRSFLATALLVAGVLITCFIPGCTIKTLSKQEKNLNPTSGNLNRQDLRDRLVSYQDYFEVVLKQAASAIDYAAASPKSRKLTLLWRTRMISASHSMMELKNPTASLIESWVLAVRHRLYLAEGEGQTIFGDQQPVAVLAAEAAEKEIEKIAREFLQENQFNATKNEVLSFAQANPIVGTFTRTVASATSVSPGQPNKFVETLQLPLAPFKAMQGVDRGAVAVDRVADAAEGFTDVVEELPESVRWQLLLWLYEFEETDMAKSFLQSIAEFSQSSRRLADSVEQLPVQLRQETEQLVRQVDERQQNLQTTLDKSAVVVRLIEQSLLQIDESAGQIEKSAQSVTETGRAWQSAAEAIGQTVADLRANSKPDDKPFDIKDYQTAAEAMTQTAQELQALTREIRDLIEGQALGQQIKDADRHLTGIVDHAADQFTLRGVILLGLALLMAIVYRLVSVQLSQHGAQ